MTTAKSSLYARTKVSADAVLFIELPPGAVTEKEVAVAAPFLSSVSSQSGRGILMLPPDASEQRLRFGDFSVPKKFFTDYFIRTDAPSGQEFNTSRYTSVPETTTGRVVNKS